MPRKAKSQATTKTAPGQAYGMAGEQVAAMQQVPLPESRIQSDMTAPTPNMGGGAPLPAPMQETNPTANLPALGSQPDINVLEGALSDAAAMPAPAAPAFSTPVSPDELAKVTPNMSQRQMTRMPSPVVDLLQSMAIAHGNDARLEEIANNAARLGY